MVRHAQFRDAFPLFQSHDLVYFDNSATTQKPQAVIDAVSDFYTHSNGNAHRGSHRLSRNATQMLERTREQLAYSLRAGARSIVFCRGATEALNLLAQGLKPQCRAGQTIILSRAEHHSNVLPWRRLAEDTGMTILYCPDQNGVPDLDALIDMLTEETKIVSLALATNGLGARLPIERIGTAMTRHSCFFILDATQALAHECLDVQQLGCDFLVGSAHKMYGPLGVGFLYGRPAALESLSPWQLGGEMVESVTHACVTYAPIPYRFEAGTLPLADIAGFGAALDFLSQWDRQALRDHEQRLFQRLYQELSSFDRFRILSPFDNNIGILTLALDEAQELGHWLDERDIAVRVGYHCAQPLFESLGTGPTLRISIAAYNNHDDCEALLKGIREWCKADHALNKSTSIPDIEALYSCQSWQERYACLMRLGQAMPRCQRLRETQSPLAACEAATWIQGQQQQTRFYFTLDSDSRLVRGLGALLLHWFHERTAQEIQHFDWVEATTALGLSKHLSASRQNGFRGMIEHILHITETLASNND